MTQFASNLKKIRKMNDYTQSELGKKLGVSDKTISSWEAGRTEPNMEMVENICRHLRCRKSDLLGFDNLFAGIGTITESVDRYLENDHASHSYYVNAKSAQYADILKDNPDYQVLFDAASKVKPEDIEKVAQMIKLMAGE